jgi:hypothetical protein
MDTPNGMPGAEATPSDPARRIKDAATNTVDRVKEAATQRAEQGVQQAASGAHNTADALRRAADTVGEENAWIGTALRKSAEGIERATQSLEGGDLSRGMADLSAFARRQPALFLGASVALGFLLARVGKTALENNQGPQNAGNSGETYISGL